MQLKLSFVSIISLTLFMACFSDVAAKDQTAFSATCDNISLDSGHILTADCEDAAGQTFPTSIDLNDCVLNNGGILQCGVNGNYFHSCNSCTLTQPSTLICNCSPKGVPTSIDLNGCISNIRSEL
ncbi:hypothetical protein HETIRDRAFT_409421, partial [Heterobasidion irregulare TC 32-1]